MKIQKIILLVALVAFAQNCNSSSSNKNRNLLLVAALASEASTSCSTNIGSNVPDWFKNNFTNVTATSDGTNLTVTTCDLPTYKSAYWPSTSSLYTSDFPSANHTNPNTIQTQSYTFTIPLNPTAASNCVSTDYDAVGVATNGVLIFNDQAAPGDQLSSEYYTFDDYNGHPQSSGVYHYHVEPTYITNGNTGKLIGLMRDGFPMYGYSASNSDDTGVTSLSSSNCYAHTTKTADFSTATTHYHMHSEDIGSPAGTQYVIITQYKGNPGAMTSSSTSSH